MPRKPPATAATPPTRQLDAPSYAQPQATADPTTFVVKHASDTDAYKAIDVLNAEHKIVPLPFPAPRGGNEPQLTFDEVVANSTTSVQIASSGQIVFHATGDCGSTSGPKTQNEVSDKMVADFQESDAREIPQFNFLLGDIVYSFGEAQYYYDQFYEPYRNYPAPILAAAGNHDGMISPLAHATSLDAFLRNFCSQGFVVTPEAAGLSRTAQIQPGVFFTFEAPFVRILTLYSNTLEDPGVISNATIGTSQVAYLDAALARVKSDKFAGALIVAHHHPAYTAGSRHGWSIDLQAQIDAACTKAGVWPHAFLAGHAHNYQRFTRTRPDGTQIPFVVCGNGGHNVQKLATGTLPLRTPQIIQAADATHDQIVFENYDDTDYGYLRIVVSAAQLRIEYHPASDGAGAKTPDDFVTIDLATRKIVHYIANDLGRPHAAATVRNLRTLGATPPTAAKSTAKKVPATAKKSSKAHSAKRRLP